MNATLAISFGSAYANDFSREGRILRVLLQADAPYRMTPEDILDLRVRNTQGEMVPFGAFTSVEWTAGTPQLDRYNGYPAMTISGSPAPGRSTGEAMAEMGRLAPRLPEGFGYEWTGVSYEEKQAAGQVGALLGCRWSSCSCCSLRCTKAGRCRSPCCSSCRSACWAPCCSRCFAGLPADVYFNVGLDRDHRPCREERDPHRRIRASRKKRAGKGPFEATMSAVKLRLRPIVMTSLAFILGMLPLVISTGAGAASRIAVGTGVMGGMIAATILGVFFIPLLYLSVRRWIARDRRNARPTPTSEPACVASFSLLTLAISARCSLAPPHVRPDLPTAPEFHKSTSAIRRPARRR